MVLPNQVYRIILPVRSLQSILEGLDLLQSRPVDGLSALVQGKTLPIDTQQQTSPSSPEGERSYSSDAYTLSRAKYRFAYLRSAFPTLSDEQISALFPLHDPLDLDLILSWSIPDPNSSSNSSRTGQSFAFSIRSAPEFSLVGPIQDQISRALLSGNKQTRTMYEETGRLRRILVDSVLDGILAREEDPVSVRLKAHGATKGVVALSFERGLEMLQVDVELRNRSPLLPVRWILRLPAGSANVM